MLYAIRPERQTTKLKVDSVAFAAFLDCPYKAYLLLVDEYARNVSPPAQHTGSFGAEGSACHDLASYKQAAIQHCQAKMECHSTVPACASSRTIRHEPLDPISTTSLDDVHTLIVELVETRTKKHRKGLLHAPVLVNPSKRISKNDKLLLGFSAMLLVQNSYAAATFGRIIHGPSFRRTTVQLPQVINKARNVLKELNSIVEGTSKPCLILNPHCNVCRFSQYCRHLALQTDDVSLISSLSRKEVLNLHKRGIFTVRQLSHLYRPRRRRRYTKLPDKHIPALKALAIRENPVYVRDPPDIPKKKVDIFLDVEGLPDDNFYYLMGLKVCEGPNEQSYSFWADNTSNEPRIWAQLLSVLASMQDYTLFHYGSYEQTFIKRMVERYGCSDAATVQHLSAALVNILTYCYQHIYFPTYSNSLKDIGRFIGFQWDSPDASGAQAIEWRTTWEAGREQSIRDRLIRYNQDDCGALKALTGALREIIERGKVGHQSVSNATEVAATSPYGLGKNAFAFPEFDYINKCAYFDYQRTKIYWRTNKRVKRITLRSRTPRRRQHKRLNAVVQSKSRTCPACKNAGILVDRRMEKVSYDLRFGPSGIKAWTTKYIGLRQWCPSCGSTFLPRSYPKGKYKYGHGLLAWVIYNKIGLRQTDESVRVGLNELFGFRFSYDIVAKTKTRAVRYYRTTYNEIMRRLRAGPLVHVDDTRVNIKGGGGYVWVFASLEEVVYVYSKSREGKILSHVLAGFKGVLVADFYSAFDSFECVQQRCLVHLIRDLNDDVFKNPFDEAFKDFVGEFGKLLKPIMQTIDRYGLKQRFLRKYKKGVEGFYKRKVQYGSQSELVQKYQERFKKNVGRLFTFLDYDGVPWNNNNAENAIKGFAAMRRGVEGSFTEKGLSEALMLLSVAQTLRNNDVSFLDFLKSGKRRLREFLGDCD